MAIVENKNILDYTHLSSDELLKDQYDYITLLPEGEGWTDFSDSSSGSRVMNLIAGLGSSLSFHLVSLKREQYLVSCYNIYSARAIAETMGYSAFRGKNMRVLVTFIATIPNTIYPFDVIGKYNNTDLVALEEKVFLSGDTVEILCTVGDLAEEIKIINTDKANRFPFFDDLVSEDFKLELNGQDLTMYPIILDDGSIIYENLLATRYKELINDKFVCITNANGSISVTYLNRHGDIQDRIGVGDYVTKTYKTQVKEIPKKGSMVLQRRNAPDNKLVDIPKGDYGTFGSESEWASGEIHYPSKTLNITLKNPMDRGDFLYVNYVVENASPVYKPSDELKLIYVKFQPQEYVRAELQLTVGSFVSVALKDNYILEESVNDIKINAPLFAETQILVRGRKDYMYEFKQLRKWGHIIDTNYTDISAAVVRLSYIKRDETFFTNEEKTEIVSELSKSEGRPLGIPEPEIEDPIRTERKISINIVANKRSDIGSIYTDLDNICDKYSKKLEADLDLTTIEQEIEALPYVKIARVEVNFPIWEGDKNYLVGELVSPQYYNGCFYECIQAGATASYPPSWTTHEGDLVNDGGVIWKTHLSGAEVTYPAWQPNTEYNDLITVSPKYANGFCYRCVQEGISGSNMPTWSLVLGTLINDGSVIWKTEINPSNKVFHRWNEYYILTYYLYPLQ